MKNSQTICQLEPTDTQTKTEQRVNLFQRSIDRQSVPKMNTKPATAVLTKWLFSASFYSLVVNQSEEFLLQFGAENRQIQRDADRFTEMQFRLFTIINKCKYIIYVLLFFLPQKFVFSQIQVPLNQLCSFSENLYENSGILIDLDGNIWVHNDSGNEPELYQIDEECQIVRSIKILGVDNIDWEDITSDRAGRVFVGDFGNNMNKRQDLVIYIIPDPSLIQSSEIIAEEIHYTYPDQNAFPPPQSEWHFDMEAFFWYNDSLYLFSKNRTNPFDGFTKLYVLPDQPGNYIAHLRDSFFCGSGYMELNWVTAADISPQFDKVALLSSNRMWVFSDFENEDFFNGTVTEFLFSSLTQKEGLAFIDQNRLVISDERFFNTGGSLYSLDIDVSVHADKFESQKKKFRYIPTHLKSIFILNLHTYQLMIYRLLFPI